MKHLFLSCAIVAQYLSGALAAQAEMTPIGSGKTIFVELLSDGDGSSWGTPFGSLQDALSVAAGGDQIWVAAGTYLPTKSFDRTISFQMRESVAVYGGFAGTEATLDERDWITNVTILSGNIGDPSTNTDNSEHVVIAAADALLDGVTVSDGYALGDDGLQGGPGAAAPPGPANGTLDGLQAETINGVEVASDTELSVHITPDFVNSGLKGSDGAGIAIYQTSMDISNTIIRDNHAGKAGGVYVMSWTGDGVPEAGQIFASPTFTNVSFIDNFAAARGGGVAIDMGSTPVFIDCIFIGNTTDAKGGAVYNDFDANPEFYNVLFAQNKAVNGAALGLDGGLTSRIVNATFIDNQSTDLGPAIYLGSGPAATPWISRSVIWNNTSDASAPSFETFHGDWLFLNDSALDDGKGWSGEGVEAIKPEFVIGSYELAGGSELKTKGWGWSADASGVAIRQNTEAADWWQAVTGDRIAVPPLELLGQHMDVVYVDATTGNDGDGTNWQTAFTDLQKGIDLAWQTGADVWVANGTYLPKETQGRYSSFMLRDGVTIFGGFAVGDVSTDARDIAANKTILSGDIGAPDLATDNSYHVVVGASDTTLDGLVIRDGYADGTLYDNRGGGLTTHDRVWDRSVGGNDRGGQSITLNNIIFEDNYAELGGAWYAVGVADDAVTNVIFRNNTADYGGALMSKIGVLYDMQNVTFENNSATYQGGAIFVDYGSRPTIDGSVFRNNTAGTSGGAIHTVTRASQVENSIVTISNTDFIGNTAGMNGGAVSNTDQSILNVSDVRFAGNTAGGEGDAISTETGAQTVVETSLFNGNASSAGIDDLSIDAESTVATKF